MDSKLQRRVGLSRPGKTIDHRYARRDRDHWSATAVHRDNEWIRHREHGSYLVGCFAGGQQNQSGSECGGHQLDGPLRHAIPSATTMPSKYMQSMVMLFTKTPPVMQAPMSRV